MGLVRIGARVAFPNNREGAIPHLAGRNADSSLSNMLAGKASKFAWSQGRQMFRNAMFCWRLHKFLIASLGLVRNRRNVAYCWNFIHTDFWRRKREYYSYFTPKEKEEIYPKDHNSAQVQRQASQTSCINAMKCRMQTCVYPKPKTILSSRPCNALKQAKSLNAKCAEYTLSFPIKVQMKWSTVRRRPQHWPFIPDRARSEKKMLKEINVSMNDSH